MSDRPRRETRRPAYYKDFQCELFIKAKKRAEVNMERLRRKANSLKEKLARNMDKAQFLMENWGSRTLLRAVGQRIEATYKELVSVFEELEKLGDADYAAQNQDWLDKAEETVEDVSDNITQHLETREGEPPSEARSSVNTERLSGVSVWKWLKESCTNPQELKEDGQDQTSKEVDVKSEQDQSEGDETREDPPKPDADVLTPEVDHPEADIDHPKSDAKHSDPDVDYPKPDVKPPMPDVKPPKPVVNRAKSDVDRPKPNVNRPKPVVKRAKSDVDRPKPVVNRPSSDVDHQKSDVNLRGGTGARPKVIKPEFRPYSEEDSESEKYFNGADGARPPERKFFTLDPLPNLPAKKSQVPEYEMPHPRSRDTVRYDGNNLGIAKPKLKQFQNGVNDNYFDWREQFDLFVDQTSVPVRNKMVMLKGSLAGKPLGHVENYGYTLDHYEAALNKLEKRYGGPRRLIQRHLKALMSQPRVQEDDLKALERFSDNIEDAVLGMRQHGGEAALLGDSAILSVVIQKTPEALFLKYQDSMPEMENLITFSAWLAEYVSRRVELKEIRDTSYNTGKSHNQPSSQDRRGGRYNPQQKSTSHAAQSKTKKHNNSSGQPKPERKSDEKCELCSKQHGVPDCPTWKSSDIHKRWDIAKDRRLCYRCLNSSHRAKFCEINKKCMIDGCTRNHHRDLHYAQKTDQPQSATNAFGVTKSGQVKISRVALRILPVRISKPGGKSVVVNAFLDDGSDSSFIRQDVVEDLGLSEQKTSLTLSTLIDSQEIESSLVSFNIESLDGTTRRLMGARTMVDLCKEMYIPNWCQKKEGWSHLVDVPFHSSPGRKTIDLVVGSDHPELTLSLEEKMGNPGEPIARRTPLGWTCTGVIDQGDSRREVWSSYAEVIKDTTLDDQFKALWNMDVIDENSEDVLTPEEKNAMSQAVKSRVKIDGRYQIALPWRDGCPQLPDNRKMAEKRLRSLEAQLARKPEVAEKYKEAFQAVIDKGYIQKLPTAPEDSGWYLPHFAVIKEDKETSKVRIVYDAAATFEGISINQQMLPGPNLQKDILEILIRFRQKPVAIGGDIKEMFNQVVLDPKERKYHRLLWRNLDSSCQMEVYEAVRLVFGDRASPFLAQYVLQQQARESQSSYPEAADIILKCTYMDDVLDSIETVPEAKKVRDELQVVSKMAGFDVRKWCSNRKEVLQDVPIEERATGVTIGDADLPNVKTLGVWWDADDDAFTFTVKWADEEVRTKRQLLSKIATTFDPFQFLAPVIIRGRIALQSAWLAGVSWDDQLPEEVQKSVNKWIGEMRKVQDLRISRCYRQKPIEDVKEQSIHTFCDASKEAYAAVCYIRFTYRDGTVQISFVGAKSRVTPLRTVSIPRLELMAAVLGVKLSKTVAKVLVIPIESHTFWTDSTDVLYWVRNQSRKFKPFVANRVSLIHESTSPSQWRHTPGKYNPADDATRGLDVGQMTADSRWCRGPDFLDKPSEEWPALEWFRIHESDDARIERPKNDVSQCSKTTTAVRSSLYDVIQLDKYSKWARLIRVWAWVLKLCRRNIPSMTLSPDDVLAAEMMVLQKVQRESFNDVFLSLEKGGKPVKQGPLRDLHPFIDSDGILRVGGRLRESDLPYDAKNPILLPKRHFVTTLIVRHYHDLGQHVRGVNGILADTRSRFWILHGREVVKTYEKECVRCQMQKKKVSDQMMASLPVQRVTSVRAFGSCGVDYGGPYIVKITRNTTDKRYLCLFTCNASRAVHLEVAYSLDTAGFLMAFSRMVARRGRPEEMVSDNGTNFVGAERELAELVKAMDRSTIGEKMSSLSIRWKFNTPLASHHGGVFESLIKSAKRALRSILAENKLRDEELQTAVVEVEGLLNSRPLVYCSSDVKDGPVLTPNHFLYGQAGGQLAPQVVDEVAFNPRHRWRYVQDLVRQAWHRWQREYLHSLQQRPKWFHESTNLKKDDIVMMVDQQNPRGRWPLARVLESFPGKDGLVRSVRVLSRGSEYRRPITKLCPLEMK